MHDWLAMGTDQRLFKLGFQARLFYLPKILKLLHQLTEEPHGMLINRFFFIINLATIVLTIKTNTFHKIKLANNINNKLAGHVINLELQNALMKLPTDRQKIGHLNNKKASLSISNLLFL